MTNGNGTSEDPGFRITLAVVYQALESLREEQRGLKTQVALMDQRMTNILDDNKEIREEVGSLRSRFNSVMIGIGTGLVLGVPALIIYVLK